MDIRIYDLKNLVSREMIMVHPCLCYHMYDMVMHCFYNNYVYDEPIIGATCIAPNLQGIYAPVYSIGPEYLLDHHKDFDLLEKSVLEEKLRIKKIRYYLE